MVVRGRVQGVGFRYWLAGAAESRSVSGWARNRPDGSVEVIFEGAPETVESLVRLCGSGPRGAEVAGVESTEEEPEGLSGFEIR